MLFGRFFCSILILAAISAGCSHSPTSPSTILPAPETPIGTASSSDETVSPSTLITPPRALGVSRLVAFGDSITWGATAAFDSNFAYAAASGGYVERLEANLNLFHQPQRFSVFNDGLPGELVVNALMRFRTMLTTRRPEGVLLLEGINDLSNGISAVSAANALRQMLDAASLLGVPVAIATMYQTYPVVDPDGHFRENGSALVPAFNAEIRRIALGRPNVLLVDLEAAMRDRRNVGTDGIHTSDSGFDVMAGTFMAAIESAFPVRGSFQ
jgi:lysophospholipase L1-like esterase